MSVVWHPKKWWNFCMSEDEKNKLNQLLLSNVYNAYNLRVLKHFAPSYSSKIFENI